MNCIVYQMWEAMDPLTGSVVVFQCNHMTRVHGQPYSLSELKNGLFCGTQTQCHQQMKMFFKIMHLEVHTCDIGQLNVS